MMGTFTSRATQVALCLFATVLPLMAFGGQVSGELRKWHPLTIDFQGPTRNELDVSPNPFLDFRLQVTFTAPRGAVYTVPGYFDGNGAGGATGSVWRVRFTPDEAGQWSYRASFRTGSAIAVDLNATAGTAAYFDGDAGTISVADRNASAAGFLKYGRLESVGRHHLKFRDGGYWLKLGTNNPENLLGYEGFDNTPNASHSYANHVADWQSGDTDWDSADRAGTTDGRGIIGALNYLAAQEINSIYFMPMNIGADGKDVWPFASPAIDREGSASNDNLHYDLSKLRQWELVFQHAQRKGLFLHFVLGDKTAANKQELDNATLGTERKLFYRELVARFGHHNALQWNISEEFNLELALSTATIRAFGQHIKALDPYDHPITVHPHGNTYATALAPFLGDDWFQIMSVQTWQEPESIGPVVEYFRRETAEADNPIPVMIDEAIGMNQITASDYRKRTVWDAWLSGGGFEMFKSFGDSDLDDFRVYQEYFGYGRNGRRFVESNLPFWDMVPADGLVSGENTLHGGAEVFAKTGHVYAIYLPSASPSPVVSLGVTGTFERSWFNPRTGQFQGSTAVVDGSAPFNLGPPPADTAEDWAVLLTVIGLANGAPVAQNQSVDVQQSTTANITLGFTDTDGPGPYTFTLLQAPASGVLGSNDGDASVTYTPNVGYTGPDSFTFRVNDGLANSNVATVSLSVGAQTTLLLETFDAADSTTVGSGWAELEATGTQVGRQGNRLVFIAAADATNRPMVTRSFQRTTMGDLLWDFKFDWTRTGTEGTYRIFMQLGDGALMNADNWDAGIGVNLVWSALNGQQQSLGYRAGTSATGLVQISGPTDVRVIAHLDRDTYDVLVGGATVRTGIPLQAAALDTVRFFADSLNASNFAGRAFDTVRVVASGGGGPANQPPVAHDQSVSVPQGGIANITLGYSDSDGPGPYAFTVLQAPANGVLGSNDGDEFVTFMPNAGYTGPANFTFRVNDGLANSNVATISLSVGGQTTLLSETFDGADSTTVGSGWTELEGAGTQLGRQGNRLVFITAANAVNQPMVTRSFQLASTGDLIWDFKFDWTRTGAEETYQVFMQLGDGSLMHPDSWDAGVGVNLVWGPLNGQHQWLGARAGTTTTGLVQISGLKDIRVIVDLDHSTYDVLVNGVTVGTVIPLDNALALDTVRFFADSVSESNFAGRAFDTVQLTLDGSGPGNQAPVAQNQSVNAPQNTTTNITLTYSDTDGPGPYAFTLLQAPMHGMLGSDNGDALVTYTPNAGYTGPDSFGFGVNDGLDGSNVATVTLDVTADPTPLLFETFDGADGTTVGPGWTELEVTGTQVGRQSNRLVFIAGADATNRPMVTRSFQRTTAGRLIWDLEFDWTRIGNEGTYRVFMQLGDGGLMNANSADAGIGVNLVWGSLNGQHQWLGYRIGGNTTGLAQISGPTDVRVIVHLDQDTYDVLVGGATVRTQIPLQAAAAFDTVRFFADSLNESNFTGKAFDSVVVTAGGNP